MKGYFKISPPRKISSAIKVMLLFIILCDEARSQNLEDFGNSKPVSVSGSFSGGLRLYEANGIAGRNNPFVWNTAGTLNFNIYGINIPFSFLYSSQNQEFRQPFNRFGVSPSYKWATLHLGYRSIEFSPYTMSGNSVLGAGFDLKPGRFRLMGMYGRFRTAVNEDTLSVVRVNPSYLRMGGAFKVGFTEESNSIALNIIFAEDKTSSIQQPIRSFITPENNFAWSVQASRQLGEKFLISGEYAQSALNQDVRTESADIEGFRIYNRLGKLFRPTISLQVAKAIEARIDYKISAGVTAGLEYQRIDPNYRTLGAYFFDNDREQISFNTTLHTPDNKLQLRAGVGTTRNNLRATQSQTLSRRAGNISISYVLNQHFNVSVNYSNFYSAINFIADPLNPYNNPEDTLNVVQISQNAGLVATYNKRSSTRSHSFSLNTGYQGQDGGRGPEAEGIPSSGMINSNLVYRLSFLPSKTTVTASLNFNQNNFNNTQTMRTGPTLGISQTMLKRRLRLTLSSSWFNSYRETSLNTITTNTRVSADFRINHHHSLNIGGSMVGRKNKSERVSTPSFQEYISTISYHYRF